MSFDVVRQDIEEALDILAGEGFEDAAKFLLSLSTEYFERSPTQASAPDAPQQEQGAVGEGETGHMPTTLRGEHVESCKYCGITDPLLSEEMEKRIMCPGVEPESSGRGDE